MWKRKAEGPKVFINKDQVWVQDNNIKYKKVFIFGQGLPNLQIQAEIKILVTMPAAAAAAAVACHWWVSAASHIRVIGRRVLFTCTPLSLMRQVVNSHKWRCARRLVIKFLFLKKTVVKIERAFNYIKALKIINFYIYACTLHFKIFILSLLTHPRVKEWVHLIKL